MERFKSAFQRREDPRPADVSPSREPVFENEPRLAYIGAALDFLHGDEGDPGAHWTQLYKEVKPFSTSLELSDNVREAVQTFVAQRLPRVKESAPSIVGIDDHNLLEALTNNYFEDVPEVEGQRREVLLATMASAVKRVETVAYKKIIENASEDELGKLGLDAQTKDLAVNLLDTSSKANPLFIRFLAYSQLSGKPPEDATPFALHGAQDGKLHTIADLFPKETRFLSERFAKLADQSGAWEGKRGGVEFKEYLQTLSKVYAEPDPAEAAHLFQELKSNSADVAISGFPIVITPGLDVSRKPPYIDPELRISLITEDSMREMASFRRAQKAMAECIDELGVGQFEHDVGNMPMQSVVAIGSYGVDLTFNAVAQEDPVVLLYLNEQFRQYDRPFPAFIRDHVGGVEGSFDGTPENERDALLQRLSRMNTMLHEFGHPVFGGDSPEVQRLGRKPYTIIDEIKADSIYRGLIPSLIETGGVEGAKEQWAAASLGSALQYLKDQPRGDAYFLSGVYTLNALTRAGAVTLEDDRAVIGDVDAYFDALKTAAKDVLAVYEDETMTGRKAARWISKRCEADEAAEAFVKRLKGESSETGSERV